MLLKIMNAEDKINPKKNPQILKWWLSSRKIMNLESMSMDEIIPINKVSKKFPLICCQKFLNWNLNNNLSEPKLTDFIESTSSVYIPVINASVPPETPGIISAIPINIPLTKRDVLNFINLFYF